MRIRLPVLFGLALLALSASGCNLFAARYYNARGLAYYKKGDYEKALADFNQAIRLSPFLAEPYTNRGLIEDLKGDYERAIADHD